MSRKNIPKNSTVIYNRSRKNKVLQKTINTKLNNGILCLFTERSSMLFNLVNICTVNLLKKVVLSQKNTNYLYSKEKGTIRVHNIDDNEDKQQLEFLTKPYTKVTMVIFVSLRNTFISKKTIIHYEVC